MNEPGSANVPALLASLHDCGAFLEERRRAVERLAALDSPAADVAQLIIDGFRRFLIGPEVSGSRRADDDATQLVQAIGHALGRMGRAHLDTILDWMRSSEFGLQYAAGLALQALLGRGTLRPEDVARCVSALTACIETTSLFETEVFEAALRALIEAGPHARPAASRLATVLGVEITGQLAAHALARIGVEGHVLLVQALAGLEPVQGAWSGEDWHAFEPRVAVLDFMPPEAAPLLVRALRGNGDRDHRYFLLEALRRLVCNFGIELPAHEVEPTILAALERELLYLESRPDEAVFGSGSLASALALLERVGTGRAMPLLESDRLAAFEDTAAVLRAIMSRA